MSPYIPDDQRRADLDFQIRQPETGGELNYQIATAVDSYVAKKGLSYQTISDIIGALLGCEAEFYERIARPYEDRKCRENGEVFTESQKALHRLRRESPPPSP